MPKGGRSFEMYEKHLMFNRKDLEGKDVLDLGAGSEVKFAKGLEDSGIHARVVSLSPDFAEQKYAMQARTSAPENELVAGIGQALPFQNESYDRVFAFHVDEHIGGPQAFFTCIEEMVRVLRPGGEARFGPLLDVPNEWRGYEELLGQKELMEKLKSQNIEIIKELVPESIVPRQKVKDRYANAYYEQEYLLVIRKK